MNSKGITPVIALSILIAIAVATSAGAYFWILSTQAVVENKAKERVSSQLDDVEFIINDITCNSTTSNITILLYNSGRKKIEDYESWIYLENSTDNSVINFSQGPITTIEVDSTSNMWPNQKIGMSGNFEYKVRVSLGGGIEIAECTAEE